MLIRYTLTALALTAALLVGPMGVGPAYANDDRICARGEYHRGDYWHCHQYRHQFGRGGYSRHQVYQPPYGGYEGHRHGHGVNSDVRKVIRGFAAAVEFLAIISGDEHR